MCEYHPTATGDTMGFVLLKMRHKRVAAVSAALSFGLMAMVDHWFGAKISYPLGLALSIVLLVLIVIENAKK